MNKTGSIEKFSVGSLKLRILHIWWCMII